MPQATLIYNPYAGKLNIANDLERAATEWRNRGWEVTLRPTERAGHAAVLAREAAERGDEVVLAVGGDGTMGQVADGLAGSQTILGPLPGGTANALAQELHLPRPQMLEPRSLENAAVALVEGDVHPVDLGYTKSSTQAIHWLLWCGIGADAFIVEQLEPRPVWSKKLGAVGYGLQAATVMQNLPSMHARVKVDDQEIEDDFLLIVISNSRLYAGGLVALNTRGVMDDGLFEVWLFLAGGTANELASSLRVARMARYMAATKLAVHDKEPGMLVIPGRHVSIQTEPATPVHTDAEAAGQTPLTCEMRPQALRLLVPASAPSDLFLDPGTPLMEAI